ncbi:hypothetical protein FACS1894189_2300 [Planctomycetales bacterium]|nr:hypothetical protein FACS1894189_2300 [Planctomycetales bacterium]
MFFLLVKNVGICDNLGLWIGLTVLVGIVGYVWYRNDPRNRILFIATGLTLAVLAVGLWVYFGVETDRKSVVRMLDALVAAIEKDDIEAVSGFIAPSADETQNKAKTNMKLVRISDARYRNLTIEVNHIASPPIAKVRFTGIFYWNSKGNIDGVIMKQPRLQFVKFNVELIKTKNNSWVVTNECKFKPSAAP